VGVDFHPSPLNVSDRDLYFTFYIHLESPWSLSWVSRGMSSGFPPQLCPLQAVPPAALSVFLLSTRCGEAFPQNQISNRFKVPVYLSHPFLSFCLIPVPQCAVFKRGIGSLALLILFLSELCSIGLSTPILWNLSASTKHNSCLQSRTNCRVYCMVQFSFESSSLLLPPTHPVFPSFLSLSFVFPPPICRVYGADRLRVDHFVEGSNYSSHSDWVANNKTLLSAPPTLGPFWSQVRCSSQADPSCGIPVLG